MRRLKVRLVPSPEMTPLPLCWPSAMWSHVTILRGLLCGRC